MAIFTGQVCIIALGARMNLLSRPRFNCPNDGVLPCSAQNHLDDGIVIEGSKHGGRFRPMRREDVWRMERGNSDRDRLPHPRHKDKDYLTNGGRIEVAQKMVGHSNAKTTGLYDRRHGDISAGEVERIGI
jgi:hypothetical protein